jgi:hypothetical protein
MGDDKREEGVVKKKCWLRHRMKRVSGERTKKRFQLEIQSDWLIRFNL